MPITTMAILAAILLTIPGLLAGAAVAWVVRQSAERVFGLTAAEGPAGYIAAAAVPAAVQGVIAGFLATSLAIRIVREADATRVALTATVVIAAFMVLGLAFIPETTMELDVGETLLLTAGTLAGALAGRSPGRPG